MEKKKQVFFIHGGSAYSDRQKFIKALKNMPLRNKYGIKSKLWRDDLRTDLGEEYEVFTPQMPNTQSSVYEEWKIWFERHFEYLHNDLILIGWSQGGMFLLKYLSENKTSFKIQTLILVASPSYYFEIEGEDGGDFVIPEENIHFIEDKADKIYIMHSKDDFVVPYDHALKFKEALPEAELITFADKNHFLVEELPELVELIKSL